ncbi:mitochondrial import inner membrane translocase subunit Tim23-like [Sabethes cyaneus]|uniref:mitochondrial import inner membrane translocase subunit Tim23-like n=1 Tax=Sabethes cyaneus TaxID=53552 RepID=UPI00237DB007|nr:mitochondrial import inner membrane translocase subunit Tim23-like [Sabethes cyaneus]
MTENPTKSARSPSYIPFKNFLREKFGRLVPYVDHNDLNSLTDLNKTNQPRPAARRMRSRVELAFPLIGGSFISGWLLGGLSGLIDGRSQTSTDSRKIRHTQIRNHVLKQGKYVSNTLASIVCIYCSIGVMLLLIRGKDGSLNTTLSGGITGLLYRSSAGLRKSLISGGYGLVIPLDDGLSGNWADEGGDADDDAMKKTPNKKQ